MQDDVFKAALAGLLHDVGKFAQRAGELGTRTWDGEAEKDYKYQHALYSGDFVEKYVPKQWREGLSGPARHHRPQTHHDRVVALADYLSAGERADDRRDHPKQLQSIFCSITGLKDENYKAISTPAAKYLPLKKLAIEKEVIFPVDTINDAHGTYKELWDEFTREATALKTAFEQNGADQAAYLESLLNLMQQYTWCIPSAYYKAVPDVSLYDHSRMTAALAACLVGLPEDQVQAWRDKEATDEPVALLVGGDISGVQKFIYTITSAGATSGLRGRSMYLQLLTEVIARYLLDTLGLPLTNIIYAGGGHFFLLIPADVAEALALAQRHISRVLLHHHQGDLYLAVAYQPVTADQFKTGKFYGCWDALQKRLQRSKERKFAELDGDLYGLIFTPKEHGGNEETFCAVCQREHPETKKRKDEEKAKCPTCYEFEELGKKLRQADYLTLEQIDPAPLPSMEQPPGDWQDVLSHFGYRALISEDLPSGWGKEVIRRTVLAIDDTALKRITPGPEQAVGRRLLVNVTPILTESEYAELRLPQNRNKIDQLPVPGSVKPFEIMAWQSRGIKRLGVLRMDVDNLGQILSQGLGHDNFTLSRMATLSFSISLFFEGWVTQIAARINAQGQQADRVVKNPGGLIYSIYSGGDDLFFVGVWDLMPLLAQHINADFGLYTGSHPGFHVSGGIALIPEKYPLYQAAEDAAAAEGKAKSKRRDRGEKNALNFLEQTILWNKFAEVQQRQEKLAELVTTGGAPKDLLQRLLKLYKEFDDARKEQEKQGEEFKTYWGPGQWQGAYSLTRLAEQNKKAKEQIEEIRDALHLENFTQIEWLGLAARWAALVTRNKGDK